MFQNRAGFFSHQIFGLTDVGKEIGTLGFYQRFIKGHQGDILRNPEVHCGKQAVEIGAGSGFCCNKGSDALLPDQLHHLLLIVNVGLMLVEEIPDRNGGFRNIACLRFLQNAVDTGANREGIPPGRRDEADALMSEGVEMTQTECTAGFIVPNDIAGIQTRKIPVDEDQGIFLQQQIKQLLAEKWLILRKQNDSADAGVDTFLQQPVFQRRIEALEKVTDIGIYGKCRKYAIDAMAPGYENYSDFSEWAFDDVKEKEYTERAFFADTEEEARQIILDYQEYLKTNNGGEMEKFLDYMTEQSKTRDDFAY